MRIHRIILTVLAPVLLGGCACMAPRGTVTQVGTIDSLLAGGYDGAFRCGKLPRLGDTGLGTFDCLDGEMVVADGAVYQVRSDGSVTRATSALGTPFAVVVKFRADRSFRVTGRCPLAQLEKIVDKVYPDHGALLALRVRGTFASMKTRSVAAQKRPYPTLAEAAKDQSIFQRDGERGTLVGFRCPDSLRGLDVPGYHLHFIADDHRSGGHVLDFVLTDGVVGVCEAKKFVFLPQPGSISPADKRDRSAELEQVEHGR